VSLNVALSQTALNEFAAKALLTVIDEQAKEFGLSRIDPEAAAGWSDVDWSTFAALAGLPQPSLDLQQTVLRQLLDRIEREERERAAKPGDQP
jgi:hypothetical protein